MLSILDSLYKYVPKISIGEEVSVGETKYTFSTDATHTILLGGDQMTAAHCRGCQLIRNNSNSDSMGFSLLQKTGMQTLFYLRYNNTSIFLVIQLHARVLVSILLYGINHFYPS